MKKFYPLITLFVFALQLLVPTQLKAQCNTPIGLSATNMSQTGAYLYLTPTSTNVVRLIFVIIVLTQPY